MEKIKTHQLIVSIIPVGPLETNCYLVQGQNSRSAILIDPGEEAELIESIIRAEKMELKFIVLTHGHFDHTGAVKELKNNYNIPVYLSLKDSWYFPEPTENLDNKTSLEFDKIKFQIIKTPGHTPGGICLFGGGVLFSGDTLFARGCGRTDLPGGSEVEIKASLKYLLESLPPETLVLPGHGPATTLAKERQNLAGNLV